MAAIARSTPSFALPATQNTAPVYEYRCLYTHDVRKKAKKWHDGSTKFHTFNRRVMVYDDTKNYIGDLHYRADEEFGEGVELQLDRGVLVEIGEPIGTTQTDLTGIVNGPHGNHGDKSVASASARSRPVQRVNHLNSQNRPKSLTELLGPSQGRLGRAVLAPTSPFEQRQALARCQDDEPVPKRQKRALGKENDYSIRQPPVVSPPAKAALPSQRATMPSARSRPSNEQTLPIQAIAESSDRHQRVIDISSDEELQPPPITSSITPHNSTTQGHVQAATNHRSMQERNRTAKKVTAQEEHVQGADKHQSIPPRILKQTRPTSPRANSSSGLDPGMSSLKMRSQPARRKLMYKALLPSSVAGQKESAVDTPVHTEEFEFDDILLDDATPHIPDCQEMDHHLGRTKTSQPRSPTRTPLAVRGAQLTPRRRDRSTDVVHPSPLFVSQTGSQRSPTPTKDFIEDNFSIPATQEVARQSFVELDDLIDSNEMDVDEAEVQSEPESPCFPQPPLRLTATARKSTKLMPPPPPQPAISPECLEPMPAQRTSSPTKTRPFARSLSANDSPLPQDPRASPLQSPITAIEVSPILLRNQHMPPLNAPPPPSRLQPQNQNIIPSEPKSKSPIQRSRSDTAAIIAKPVAPILPVDTSVSDEQGAWTSLEAFLLFEKWPACKAKRKPVFERPDTNAKGNDDNPDGGNDSDDQDGFRFVPSPAARRMPHVLIRSARSFMRDGC